jgi:hypothetical protein
MTSLSTPERAVPSILRWRLVWGVVVLQVALQLGWIAYRAYQPALLQDHGFSNLLVTFAVLPGVLGLVIEPLSGVLTDLRAERVRERMLPITITVLVAGLIFITVVTLVGSGLAAQSSLLLPGLMVAWLVAVQASSTPTLALLTEAASIQNLPRAAALVTLAQGLIGAGSGSLSEAALRLGATGTFLLGAMVLAFGLLVLRTLPEPVAPIAAPTPLPQRERQLDLACCARLLLTAVAAGAVLQVLVDGLPRVQPYGGATVVQLCSALAAVFAGRWVSRWGRRESFLAGLATLASLLALTLVLPPGLVPPLLPLLGVLHSIVLISLTSLALASLPAAWSGLGAGLVLGGSGLAGSLSLLFFGASGPAATSSFLAVLLVGGVVALLACWALRSSSTCLAASQK